MHSNAAAIIIMPTTSNLCNNKETNFIFPYEWNNIEGNSMRLDFGVSFSCPYSSSTPLLETATARLLQLHLLNQTVQQSGVEQAFDGD